MAAASGGGSVYVAQAAVQDAQTNWDKVKNGPNPADVAALRVTAHLTPGGSEFELTALDGTGVELDTTLRDGRLLFSAPLPSESAASGQASGPPPRNRPARSTTASVTSTVKLPSPPGNAMGTV